MSLNIEHCGLYFAAAQIAAAQKDREKVPHLQTAWQWLMASAGSVVFERKLKGSEPEQVVKAPLSDLGQALENAFCYRFLGDESAAKTAWEYLQNSTLASSQELVAAAHLAELLAPLVSDSWRQHYADMSATALANYAESDAFAKLWLIALQMVSGVVLEDSQRIEQGAERFRQMIDEQIHPEGYFRALVVDAKEAFPVFQQHLLGLGALSLAAEAGERAGLKLWQYEKRDVGLNTAASYLVYYYFYPDKWRWGTGLTEADTRAAFAESGAFMEILTSHVNPRGVELLMDEQRPFFSAMLGGLTTLSHYQMEKRKRGFFG